MCLDCRRENRTDLTGTQRANERQAQRTTELHENIEDLLRFGATYEEIVSRSGFATEKSMKESLRRRNRNDLLEQLQDKKGAGRPTNSIIAGKPNSAKRRTAVPRGEWITSSR